MNWLNDWITYITIDLSHILNLTMEHVELVGLSAIVAIAIGVPLGIYLTTNEALAGTVLQATSIIMTIPSIALFGIMIPVFSLINQGIGFVPAFIALILYSQLPIIRNTYTAIKNVNPDLKDAAIGIGMKPIQRLVRVEIPNAIPIIMAGVRTSVVMNIGIGAIASFIGAGGLGVLINQGITRSDEKLIVTGALAVSVLAIIADAILWIVQKLLTSRGLTD
ncbi:osmoprotectant transport system permease protein [Scopulibacillus darangshiensis]|uniref:Osmoprotectant transport system permease protein n=2 Tax=Scopulibacillus darangshiensis TaxID=442528 RepID=A0A4R2P6Q4_9BACL|nr:ABC transporter permease [Scopulibacillus darangshiensis]TCP29485.1 osmoprotectant transport system permease protein [Scopulibacillus darangshiensis]